jgi:HlyD family secretion protein
MPSTPPNRSDNGASNGSTAPDSGPDDILTSGSATGASESGDTASTGEGVDRKIDTPTFTPKRIAIAVGALVLVAGIAYGVWTTATGGQALNVDRDKLTISKVQQGEFLEFIAVTGNAVPKQTVYLEAVEGGRVEEVYVQEGAMVEEGQSILRLSNNDLRLSMLNSEASLAEQTSSMQQLRFRMEQNRLDLQQELANMRYQVQRLKRQHQRQKRLYEKDVIAASQYKDTRDELEYQQRRMRLTRRAYRKDSLAQAERLQQMEETVENVRRNFQALQKTLSNLTVEAPISGQLTTLDAEVGQIRSQGARLGQVDVVDSFKVQAQIDEFYIDRVQPGQTATTQQTGGQSYEMEVTRVYPEVQNGQFRVDLQFTGERPESLRRGQSVRLRLQLGSPEEATLLARGGFYQSTGGNWAYVLGEDGEVARREPIRLGRQNPNHFEVLGGLEPGERVVTSSYDTFGEADRLVLE